MKTFFTFISISLFLLNSSSYAQKTPIGLLPLADNGSFAGSSGNSRLFLNGQYGLNNSTKSKGTYTYNLYSSYDNFIEKIGSGIGFSAGHYEQRNKFDNVDVLTSRGTFLTGTIAPKISFNERFTLSPSFSLTYNKRQTTLGYISSSFDSTINSDGFTGRLGLALNNGNYYVALDAQLFQSGSIKNFPNSGKQLFLQGAYTFQRGEESRFSFTPHLRIGYSFGNEYSSSGFGNAAYNLNFRYDDYYFGLFSQSLPDSYKPGVQLGWQKNGFKIMVLTEFIDYFNSQLTLRYLFHQKGHNTFRNLY